jgi:hypothetical protein
MHIALPNGDMLVPDAEFRKKAGDISDRTGRLWDDQGCPYIMVGGRKYRPLNEALAWLAGRIQRLNPSRRDVVRRAIQEDAGTRRAT